MFLLTMSPIDKSNDLSGKKVNPLENDKTQEATNPDSELYDSVKNNTNNTASLGIVLEGENKPFNINNFGAGIGMLGDALKPNMTEKEFREAVVKELAKKTGIPADEKRVAAINTFITAIKNGAPVQGYHGDGRTQYLFLLNLWKNPEQPLPIM